MERGSISSKTGSEYYNYYSYIEGTVTFLINFSGPIMRSMVRAYM
jgi:hypothetical protein